MSQIETLYRAAKSMEFQATRTMAESSPCKTMQRYQQARAWRNKLAKDSRRKNRRRR